MTPAPILLAGDEETTIKMIAAAIILVAWVVRSLLAAANKATKNTANPPSRAQLAARTLPPVATRQTSPPQRPAALLRNPQSAPPAPRRVPVSVGLPPLRGRANPARSSAPAGRGAADRSALVQNDRRVGVARQPLTVHPKSDTPMRAALSQSLSPRIVALIRPTTIRAQFILAEVLQPPVSLRTRKNL